MSLSGKLEIFPLEEVLRLLARSHQSGCLRVEGPGAGRIYLEGGSMTYAAVEPDEALRAHLLAAGVVTEAALSSIDLSNGTLAEALAPGASTAALGDVIREQCVESVYRIRRPLAGPFAFTVDARPRWATGQSYDIEMIVSEADRRANEWADIEAAVSDLASPWHMVPTLDEESVKLSDSAWRFLAALEGSSSVRDLAGRLGLTDFQAARRMAELSRAHLVEQVVGEERLVEPVTDEPSAVADDVVAGAAAAWYEPEAPAAETPVEPVAEETPAASEVEAAPERSWWEEPTAGADTTDEPAEEGGFLESVFSELETTEGAEGAAEATEETETPEAAEEPEGEGGFGLLRRRGLGAAFRELADS